MRILIKQGRLIDPGTRDGVADILVEDGVIRQIDDAIATSPDAPVDRVVDATGKIVTPGLIDMHVHLRDPGFEYKETVESGCRAAAAGGFTAVCPMPNTDPVCDTGQVIRFINQKAETAGAARVYPVAAISKGLTGKGLCEYAELREAGAVALSDDGGPVTSSELLRRAFEYAKLFKLPLISHCEDLDLGARGVMNEGWVSTRLGLPGIPNAAESIMVMRDIALCELTRAPLHIAHVSTKESVRVIREAKQRGAPVTAETAPHYFTLTDEAVVDYNTHAKMNPPLRSEADRQAVLEGLADGTLDTLATDHAPQNSIEKDMEFDLAANGIIGLETSVSLCLDLVARGVISLVQLVEKMSTNPGRIIGHENRLTTGQTADITILDTERRYTIRADRFNSLSRNTPFDGWEVKGKAVMTLVDGRIVFEDL
jgi:dihydroorotase